MQIVKQTNKEKTAMYMKLPKKKLVEMLINCNDVLDGLTKPYKILNDSKTEEPNISPFKLDWPYKWIYIKIGFKSFFKKW